MSTETRLLLMQTQSLFEMIEDLCLDKDNIYDISFLASMQKDIIEEFFESGEFIDNTPFVINFLDERTQKTQSLTERIVSLFK